MLHILKWSKKNVWFEWNCKQDKTLEHSFNTNAKKPYEYEIDIPHIE